MAKNPNTKGYLVDSGAFSFVTGKKQKSWDEWLRYCDEYADFVRETKSQNYFEMDVDDILGIEKVEIMRKRIEKRVGWQSIPVWHIKRGWGYFEKMCGEYPYVAIGGYAKNIDASAINKTFHYFINYAHKVGVQIHGLGFTNLGQLKSLPFDSVDSTSWLAGARYGKVYQISGNTLVIRGKQNLGLRADGHRAAAHNLKSISAYAKMVDK